MTSPPMGPPLGWSVPDARVLFLVNLAAVLALALFSAAVVVVLLKRSYQRRLQEQKLTAVGTATARILHQVKNPLQTIVLHAELLNDAAVDADAEGRRELARALLGEAERMAAMLTELSQWAAGARRTMRLEPYPVHELMRQVLRAHQRDAAAGGLTLEAPRLDTLYVAADAYYLHQAVENLVRNACEALQGQGGGRLTLSLEARGGHAVLSVADSGPGIEPERQAAIFEPFVSGKGKGMGLGLPICREIVEAHGGRLELQSAPGQGTVFRMVLPLSAPPAAGVEPERAGLLDASPPAL